MIDLRSPLTFKNAFCFPLQDRAAIREVLIGAAWLFVPFLGWLMNMGHRIVIVHKMQHGLSPWPSWNDWRSLLKHGLVTWLGMVYYYFPAVFVFVLSHYLNLPTLFIVAILLFILGTLAIPGYMSHYCKDFDYAEIFNPIKAFRRSIEGGRSYWLAWIIALGALFLSFFGLIVFGIGFFATSVWFWQVAGYAFANVFTRAYQLQQG